MNLSCVALLGLSVCHVVAADSLVRAIDEVESDTGMGWCPARNAIAEGLDIPGQTVLNCTQGLDCPESPNLWRFDNLQDPYMIDARLLTDEFAGKRGELKKFFKTQYSPIWGFKQSVNQYFYANYNELVPTKTISKRDSNGIPPLEYHPDSTTLWNEIKALHVPVPPFVNEDKGLNLQFSPPLTVEEILTNSERVVVEPGTLDYLDGLWKNFTYKIKDIFPTDGLMILYEGKIVYENYFSFADEKEEKGSEWANTFDRWSRHRSYSMSKSFAGTMVKMLEHDLKGTPKSFTMEDDITDVIPFLDESMWKGVTIQMILDMTVSINADEYASDCYQGKPKYKEYMRNIANAAKDDFGFIDKSAIEVPDECQNLHFYLSSGADLLDYYTTANWFLEDQLLESLNQNHCNKTSPLRYNTAAEFASIGIRRALQVVEKGKGEREHGERFEYLSIITHMLGWIIEHLTDYNSIGYFSKRIWSKMGAESDATIATDDLRFPAWDGGGFSGSLRDFARFGEMTRNNGKIYRPNPGHPDKPTAEQIIAEEIVLDSKGGGNYTPFEKSRGTSAITCLVNNGDVPVYISQNETKLCSDIVNNPPVASWLEAIGKCADSESCEGVNTGLHYNYRNQFWGIVDDTGTEQKPGGLIYQEGVRGQSVWTFDDAKLVIARLGSNAATTSSMHVWEYISNVVDNSSGVDSAMYRTFFEIAAHMTNIVNKGENRSNKSKAHKSTKGKKKQGSPEKNIFQN